ncbi:MAG: NusG domain II-containing protein [Calditrichaeota bacterium]|nr:MAG: NusG domain II-containing protein [Calditrichota bacterium]
MRQSWRRVLALLTVGDKILILLLATSSLFSVYFVRPVSTPGSVVRVEVQGKEVLHKRLDRDTVFRVTGPAGQTRIEIRGGHVRVLDSDCPQKLCVRQGRISHPGRAIICVPNRVMIWIEGSRRNKFDAVTG